MFTKLLITALALVGSFFLLAIFAPTAWTEGFHVQNHLVPWGGVGLGVVGILAWRLKAK